MAVKAFQNPWVRSGILSVAIIAIIVGVTYKIKENNAAKQSVKIENGSVPLSKRDKIPIEQTSDRQLASLDGSDALKAEVGSKLSHLKTEMVIAESGPLEFERLERFKEKISIDIDKGLMGNSFSDYFARFKDEVRDPVWAPQAEAGISQELASLPLRKFGLSPPVVRCTSTVCEIMIIQDISGAADANTNWQTLFGELAASQRLGVSSVDTAMLMTQIGGGRIGFISYVLTDH